MQMTFEKLQSLLTDLSALFQFSVAILGLIAVLMPFIQRLTIYDDDSTYILPNYITSFLSKTLIQLGIPQLMVYIRPQEYYDNLAKELNESDLAKTSQGANVCLASMIEADDDSAFVSGLVNTGNSCFLNSVLQALSSLPHLHQHLEHISNITTGIPLPVTRSLLKTIRTLTKPLYRRSSFRPVDIVAALSSNRRIISREQQDAQEFFQLVSSAIDVEGQKIVKTELLGGGLKDLLHHTTSKGVFRTEWTQKKNEKKKTTKGKLEYTVQTNEYLENPFTGLLANRLSCMHCGYTSAIRHFSFNNIQLNVPNKYTTTLEECLNQFVSMEYLQDASCRKCSFEYSIKTLSKKIESLESLSKKEKRPKKKRALLVELVELEKQMRDISNRLNLGRIEEEVQDNSKSLIQSLSRPSSKQVMLAKPPKILCLHISRSAFLSTGAIYKNTCQIIFPEYLNSSPFCTNGTLNSQPDIPISSSTAQSDNSAIESKRYYRLMSVVVHYGSHSFGHFVAFKRRIYAAACQCHICSNNDKSSQEQWKCQNCWYRISDSKVDECSLEDVLRANPYMLLYELVNEVDLNDNNTSLSSSDIEWEAEEELPAHDSNIVVKEESSEGIANYNYIPMDDATKEALRIANSLLVGDQLGETTTVDSLLAVD